MDLDGKSSLGYEEGSVATACYFPGIAFFVYFAEQKSHFVRFHALQSMLGYIAIGAVWLVMRLVPALNKFTFVPSLTALVFSFMMMYHSHYGEEYEFPVVGSLAHKMIYEHREDFLEDADDTHPTPDTKGK